MKNRLPPPIALRSLTPGRRSLPTALCLLASTLLPLGAAAQTTVQSTTYASGQTAAVSGPTTLTAGPAVTVSSGANVAFYASTSITLSPGFTAAAGSTFHAVNTAGAPAYALTVTNGTGGGSGFPAGTVLTITATGSGTFNNWTLVSGSGTFGSTTAATTTFTLGSANAVVQANFTFDPNADNDGDGVPNGIEQQLGTNPNVAAQSDTANSTQLKITKPQ